MSTAAAKISYNPHSTAFSSYAEPYSGRMVPVGLPDMVITGEELDAFNAFRQHVEDGSFPCIGAKAALNGNHFRYGFYPAINSSEATSGLAHDLWEFANEQSSFNSNYATFITCFGGPRVMDELMWERRLWEQLQRLHELDDSDWDTTVSSKPGTANFSFSFAGTAFFVVGLHTGASRLARQFQWPTLVFNFHAQFERLRGEGQFERMQSTIRARDLKLQGSLNPNLSDFGKQSEAKQYSGRAVEDDWKCPFKRLLGHFAKNPHG